jgi:hypothetical protein
MFQQLGGTANAPQRVLDFMRQVTNQLAIGLLLQQKPLFIGNFQLLIQWPQLYQRQPAFGINGGDGQGDVQWLLAMRRAQFQIVLDIAGVVLQRSGEGLPQGRAVLQQLEQRMA